MGDGEGLGLGEGLGVGEGLGDGVGDVPCNTANCGLLVDASSLLNPANPSPAAVPFTANATDVAPASFCCLR